MLQWLGVAICSVVWMLTYRYMGHCIPYSLDYDSRCRIITIVHAVVVFICGILTVCYEQNGIVFPSK